MPKGFRYRVRRVIRPARHAAAAAAFRSLPALLRMLPRRLVLLMGEAGGGAARLLSRQSWKLALRNIEEIHAVDRRLAERMARGAFRQAGRNTIEMLARAPHPELVARCVDVDAEEMDRFRRANRKGGTLLLVPHLGAFEMLGTVFSARGFELCVPSTPAKSEALEKVLRDRRAAAGARTVPRRGSMSGLEEHLQKGGVLVILMDQDTKVKSIDVDFLGHPARTPIGPARIVAKMGVPVFCASIHLGRGDRHRVRVTQVLEAGGEQDIASLTRRFNDAIAEHIAFAPAQWVWYHRRWRFGNGANRSGCATPIALLLALSPLLLPACERSADDIPPAPRAEGPDQIVQEFTLRESARGSVRWSLRAEVARIYRETHTELDRVFLVFVDEAGDTMTTIEAERGHRKARSEAVSAMGKVEVVQRDGTVVLTDSLAWNPETQRITTDAPVEIRQGGDVIRGIGLDADPSLDDVVLKGSVSGRVEDPGFE